MTTQRETRTTRPETNGAAPPPAILAFTSAEKAERYDSGRFRGATGLNWYTSDPSLQRALTPPPADGTLPGIS